MLKAKSVRRHILNTNGAFTIIRSNYSAELNERVWYLFVSQVEQPSFVSLYVKTEMLKFLQESENDETLKNDKVSSTR